MIQITHQQCKYIKINDINLLMNYMILVPEPKYSPQYLTLGNINMFSHKIISSIS